MRKSLPLVLASVASLLAADIAAAQPGPPPPPGSYRPGPPSRGYAPPPGEQRYYYNGRWLGPQEWNRRAPERQRWAHNYERRRGRDHDDNGSSLVAGIIGFALGAAIVGSLAQAEHARTADADWDSYCARKYRSYDRRSRTYLGTDGLRHYCQ